MDVFVANNTESMIQKTRGHMMPPFFFDFVAFTKGARMSPFFSQKYPSHPEEPV
jgi:hypothetical protein